MSWIDGIAHRIRRVLRPGDFERELDEQISLHTDLDAQRHGDNGETRIRRRFGNSTWWREETRRVTALAFFDVLRSDTTWAWRSIRRAPTVTTMVVLTLALGLAVNAATFSLLDILFLRAPEGVRDPGSLRRVWFEQSAQSSRDGERHVRDQTSFPIYRTVARVSGDPLRVAAFYSDNALYLRHSDERTRVRGVFASASYFPTLGVQPAIGRLYTAAEDSMGNGSRVALLSHRFWRRQFGGDSAIVGASVRIEGEPYLVVGVLQHGFDGLDLQAPDLWLPLAAIPAAHWISQRRSWWQGDRTRSFNVIARDAAVPSQFEARATRAVREINRELRPAAPDTLARVLTAGLTGRGYGELGQDMLVSTRLAGVALIILVIACANAINLLLARAIRRRREIAVRLALGVSKARLLRLLTTETLVLATIAALVALAMGAWGGALLRALVLPSVTWYESAFHWRVALFTGGVALLAGLVAGIVPAMQSMKLQLTGALKGDARDGGTTHKSGLRAAMVAVQAAFSLVLLVGAALFARSLDNVTGLDLGYDSNRLVFGTVRFEPGRGASPAVVTATMTEIAERLRSRPGVEGVAQANDGPMRSLSVSPIWWDADSSASLADPPTWTPVSASYFPVVGMRMVAGSAFDDRAGAPRQLVVNETMARRLWPPGGGDAIGKCIRVGNRAAPCYVVTGIVEDARRVNVIEEPSAQFYLPVRNLPNAWEAGVSLVVRARDGRGELDVATTQLGELLRAAFPGADVNLTRMSEHLDHEYWPWRLGARLFAGFGALALLVALIGVYTAVSYGVSERTRELGVRMALGARSADVLRLVLRDSLRVVGIGAVAGIVVALAGGRLVAGLLYGVAATDATVLVVAAASLVAAAAVASLVPAWRAVRIDPVTSLRAD